MIELEVLNDSNTPHVGITLTGVSASAVVTIEVNWGDGWHPIVGGTEQDASGGAFIRDFFPPLNTQAQYRATLVSGTMTGADTATVTVTSPFAFLHDPLNPRNAVSVSAGLDGDETLLAGSFASAAYEQDVDSVGIVGGGTVSSFGVRGEASGVPIRLQHDVAAEAGRLRRLLRQAGSLILTGHPSNILPAVAHIAVGTVTEERDGDFGQIATYNLTASEDGPVPLTLVVPWWTYDQVRAIWSGQTYNAVKAARPGASYVTWRRSPDA